MTTKGKTRVTLEVTTGVLRDFDQYLKEKGMKRGPQVEVLMKKQVEEWEGNVDGGRLPHVREAYA